MSVIYNNKEKKMNDIHTDPTTNEVPAFLERKADGSEVLVATIQTAEDLGATEAATGEPAQV